MSEPVADILDLYVVNGLSQAEVAFVLGVKVTTVRRILSDHARRCGRMYASWLPRADQPLPPRLAHLAPRLKARRCEMKAIRSAAQGPREPSERDLAIAAMLEAGASQKHIAERFGISRARAHQLAQRIERRRAA